ncbi:MAG: cadherin domain-containing protein [Hyphomicrobiaceae bacterium]|nr:cadherin domain-containing protein [Hyphomicrobiaceae bacterium]MCC0023954.1 cadherin domain-containing protein [Hyphomicrobiaceae bacterium]
MTAFASATSETLVNSTTTNQQVNSSVAQLTGGGWVVVWETKSGSNYTLVEFRQFDADGNVVVSQKQVASGSQSDSRDPDVVGLADGGFLITYDGSASGDSYGITQVRYNDSGSPIAGGRVNTTTSPTQIEPSAAALPGGGWVVTWSSNNQVANNSSFDIYQQIYDNSGSKVGGETLVNTTTSGNQLHSEITVLDDGGWLVTWSSSSGDGSDYGVYQQRYDSSGAPVGGETLVNTFTNSYQTYSEVTALSDGGWVVVWESLDQDGSNFGIYMQRYDSDGNSVGSETRVNTTTANAQFHPVVAELTGGGWVVVWHSTNQDGNSNGIYMQRYDADGNAVGDETLVNETTSGDQSEPSVAALADGSFVVTWEGNGTGDGAGIFQRVFTPPTVDGTNADDALTGTANDDTIFGYAGADLISGGDGGDTIHGDAGADIIRGDGGDDTIDGGADTDRAVYSGNWSDYTITESGGTLTIVDNRPGSPDGTDTVKNVEFFAFADGTVTEAQAVQAAPTAIAADSLSVDENSGGGTLVGTLTTTDVNSLDSFTYALTKDPSGFFEIVGDKLQVKAGAMLDFESVSRYKVTVEVTDAAGATHSEKLRIDVTDLAENIVLTTGDDVFRDKATTETSISGDNGNDRIVGSDKMDTISGDAGNDRINGRRGADDLAGGTGDDRLRGGGGQDIFHFETGWGRDRILDFDATGARHDQIDLSGLATIESWTDLEQHHLSTKGANVIIDGLNGDVLILRHVDPNTLDSSDFIF